MLGVIPLVPLLLGMARVVRGFLLPIQVKHIKGTDLQSGEYEARLMRTYPLGA